MKKVFTIVLALAMVVCILPQSASAASVPAYHLAYFAQFDKVPPSNNYAVAAVSVQKFLMLFGHSYAKELMVYGADGFYGNTTKTQAQRFQCQERPHGGTENQEKANSNYGTVDTATWKAIAANIEYTDLLDTGGGYFHRFNRSYYDITENVIAWNGQAYYAYNEHSIINTPFYPH